MTKYYYDRHGNQVPRHLAIDPATGSVRDGFTVSVPQRMCDSATVIVRDTPPTAGETAEDAAFARYAARHTRAPRDDADKAPIVPATDEQAAFEAYASRFTARKDA
jgi:hypothetical protein